MKKVLRGLGLVIFEMAIAIVLMFNLATLFPIPYLGSIANHYTVPYVRIWLPVLFIFFLISLFFAFDAHKSKWDLINTILTGLSLLSGLYMIISIQTNLNQLGGNVNFLHSYQVKEPSGIKTDIKVYDYSHYGPVKMNVYYKNDHKTDKPVLVYIHGGGWIAGHRASHSYYWKTFAKKGYVVVSLDYDLSSKHRHLSDVTERQLTKGFAWVANNIDQYGGNSQKLYATGVSAGGNLALELAYKINKGSYKTANKTPLPKVRAVSVLYPVADPESFYENDDLVKGDLAKAMAMSYLGGRPDQLPKKYDALTPKHAISKETPPTLMISGARDTLVPQDATYDLAATLTEKQIANKLVIMPYTNHAFDRVDGNLGSQAYLNMTMDWFEEYGDITKHQK